MQQNQPTRSIPAQKPLLELQKGDVFDGFLLVKASEQRTASNGGKYLDMTLGDISGEMNAKMWDGTISAPPVGMPIRVRGLIQEFKDRAQFRVDRMRPSTPDDHVDMSTLIPCAPFEPEQMFFELKDRAERIGNDDLRKIVLFRLEESEVPLMYFPAAAKLHHAERSGLLHHTSTMLKTAQAVCRIYTDLDEDLLCAGVILHDLAKLTELNSDELGLANEYTAQGQLLGHITQGIAELARAARELDTDPELLLMLQHMILAHHNQPDYGSPKRPMFPEAQMLHLLDLMDAQMYEMRSVLKTLNPGSFSGNIWSLDQRKLYRRKGALEAHEEV